MQIFDILNRSTQQFQIETLNVYQVDYHLRASTYLIQIVAIIFLIEFKFPLINMNKVFFSILYVF